jgi:hypothetical protein
VVLLLVLLEVGRDPLLTRDCSDGCQQQQLGPPFHPAPAISSSSSSSSSSSWGAEAYVVATPMATLPAGGTFLPLLKPLAPHTRRRVPVAAAAAPLLSACSSTAAAAHAALVAVAAAPRPPSPLARDHSSAGDNNNNNNNNNNNGNVLHRTFPPPRRRDRLIAPNSFVGIGPERRTPTLQEVLRNNAATTRGGGRPELAELMPILGGIEIACKTIATLVGKPHLAGEVGRVNVQGETQKKLDVICNEVVKEALCRTGELHCVASEEEDEPIQCPVVVRLLFYYLTIERKKHRNISLQHLTHTPNQLLKNTENSRSTIALTVGNTR